MNTQHLDSRNSKLLSLPPELRNSIYETLAADCIFLVEQRYEKPWDINIGTQALLATCKQTRSELAAVIKHTAPHVLDVVHYYDRDYDNPCATLFPPKAKKVWLRMGFSGFGRKSRPRQARALQKAWTDVLQAMERQTDLEEVVLIRERGFRDEKPHAEAVAALKRLPRLRRYVVSLDRQLRDAEKDEEGKWTYFTGWAEEILGMDLWTEATPR